MWRLRRPQEDPMTKSQKILHSRQSRILYYILGFLVVGLGVNVMNSSNLGVGAWDTVTINLRSFMNIVVGWQWVTIGMMSFVVSILVMTMVILYRKDTRYFFMFIPIALVFLSIDFWNIVVFDDRIAGVGFWETSVFIGKATIWQYIFFLVGSFILPLGLTMVVKSAFPAFVFDEWMLMLMDVFKTTKITFVRLAIEILGLGIGTLFGYLTFFGTEGHLGSVNWGSLLFTIFFTSIMGMWFHVLQVQKHE